MSHAPIKWWSPVEDSNLRHSVCRTDVLAAELTGVPLCLKCWWSELESSQPLRVFGATLIRLSYPTTKVEERCGRGCSASPHPWPALCSFASDLHHCLA